MNAPKKKRTLQLGCSGKDVQAVQRALQKGLKAKSQKTVLAPTGTYGDGTVTDCQTFQKCHGIQASGSMGQPTLDALWPYVDAYGTSLYLRAKLGQPTQLGSPIKKGAKGDRVRAAQQAFWRMRGADCQNARNGTFGDGLQKDIQFFAKATDQKISTDQISQGTWECIWAFMDAYAMNLAEAAAEQNSGPSSADAIRSALVTWAEWYVATGGGYAQVRPYQRDNPPKSPLRNDCSGSIHHLMLLAGGPDPSGLDFNGSGYTGTMQSRGERIDLAGAPGNLRAGDCIFYGNQGGGVSSHVEMFLDTNRQFGFGSTPPTIHTYTSYRTYDRRADIGARRYF